MMIYTQLNQSLIYRDVNNKNIWIDFCVIDRILFNNQLIVVLIINKQKFVRFFLNFYCFNFYFNFFY